jgi:hypothetical protein
LKARENGALASGASCHLMVKAGFIC